MEIDAASAEQCLLIKGGQNSVTEKAKNLQLEQYGFDPNVMKKTKVCPTCGQLASARSMICSRCGARLPFATLFDSYKRRHPCCPHCSTVLAADANYCPHCGKLINTDDITGKKQPLETKGRSSKMRRILL